MNLRALVPNDVFGRPFSEEGVEAIGRRHHVGGKVTRQLANARRLMIRTIVSLLGGSISRREVGSRSTAEGQAQMMGKAVQTSGPAPAWG